MRTTPILCALFLSGCASVSEGPAQGTLQLLDGPRPGYHWAVAPGVCLTDDYCTSAHWACVKAESFIHDHDRYVDDRLCGKRP